MGKEDFKELDELRWITVNGKTRYFGKLVRNQAAKAKESISIVGIEVTPDKEKYAIHNWFKKVNLKEEDIIQLEGDYSLQVKTLSEKEKSKCEYWATQMQYIRSKAIQMLENKYFDEGV